jgi:hypothetical protein
VSDLLSPAAQVVIDVALECGWERVLVPGELRRPHSLLRAVVGDAEVLFAEHSHLVLRFPLAAVSTPAGWEDAVQAVLAEITPF